MNKNSPAVDDFVGITHDQFFDDLRTSRENMLGEKKLMLRILEDGIHLYQKYSIATNGSKKRLYLQLKAWIMSHNRSWVFSFENICEAFNLDPSYIRRGIRRLVPEDRKD